MSKPSNAAEYLKAIAENPLPRNDEFYQTLVCSLDLATFQVYQPTFRRLQILTQHYKERDERINIEIYDHSGIDEVTSALIFVDQYRKQCAEGVGDEYKGHILYRRDGHTSAIVTYRNNIIFFESSERRMEIREVAYRAKDFREQVERTACIYTGEIPQNRKFLL